MIRVVIVDDSSMVRTLLRSFLEGEAGIEIVGEAANGRQAIELARELKPDLITMDLEMPVMNGLEAIQEIMFSKAVPILVVSSVADAQMAVEALSCGALEVLGKPDYTPEQAANFVARVRLLAGVSVITRRRLWSPPALAVAAPTGLAATSDYPHVFAIASSTGGPQALAQILPALPAGFPCPVVIAQHIADGFAGGMAEWLSSLCKLPVRLASEGDLLQPGVIHLAPSEAHLQITPTRRLSLVERGPLDIYHPSCNILLSSVAEVFGSQAVGIILTGMGSDGAKGISRIREKGGVTLGQDEASSVIYGMNQVAIASGDVQQVLAVDAIANAMIRLASAGPRLS